MVLKDDLHDRENDKFYEDSNGNTTVRTNDSILDEVKIDSNDVLLDAIPAIDFEF